MNAPKPLKPIIAAFRDAGRLVNEWRDTLTLGAIFITAGVGYRYGYSPMLIGTTGVAARQFIRSTVWNWWPLKVGHLDASPFPEMVCRHAVTAGTPVAGVPFILNAVAYTAANVRSLEQAAPLLIAGGALALTLHATTIGAMKSAERIGGRKGVVRVYRELLWDYPRKNGNGPTVTGRLQNWLSPPKASASLS